jgi:PRD1 phage membrane DNA delivery
MSDKLIDGLIAIGVAVVGLATIAVIFSQKAQTAGVITSGGNAFASIIKAAVAPVS